MKDTNDCLNNLNVVQQEETGRKEEEQAYRMLGCFAAVISQHNTKNGTIRVISDGATSDPIHGSDVIANNMKKVIQDEKRKVKWESYSN